MRIAEYSLVLCSLFMNSNGLDCRSEGGPKENDLKRIFSICMKQQGKNNNSNNDGDFEQDWRETRRFNQWSRDNVPSNKENTNNGYGTQERGQGEENKMDNRENSEEKHKMTRQDGRSKNRENRMQHWDRDEDDKMHSRDGDQSMYSRNGRGEKQNSNGENKSQRNKAVNDRNDFFQNDNFGGYNNNQHTTQPTRRFKRERRVEVNSGKRSQYNPNPQRFSGNEETYKDDTNNSSESNTTNDESNIACAVQCLLENLEMTDASGMPDRYLVTHAITKDVKDEDLTDFLQESVEECFQLLDNENTEDKCEFSKKLLMCLSEKGRANCDDWKDDFQF